MLADLFGRPLGVSREDAEAALGVPTVKCEGSCVVCLGDLAECQSEVVEIPACKHQFCKDCLIPWLERKNSCPLCRAQVAKRDPESQGGMPRDASERFSSLLAHAFVSLTRNVQAASQRAQAARQSAAQASENGAHEHQTAAQAESSDDQSQHTPVLSDYWTLPFQQVHVHSEAIGTSLPQQSAANQAEPVDEAVPMEVDNATSHEQENIEQVSNAADLSAQALSRCSVRTLKCIARARGISLDGLIEKHELVEALQSSGPSIT
jgi:cell pole-organizing protein PopZ